MDDQISRKAAIDALNKLDVSDGVGISSIACSVQESAISAIQHLPSAQPEKRTEERTETHACDLIDRQAAIDTLDKHLRTTDVPVSYPGIISALTEWLNELPSAQPEVLACGEGELTAQPEIIQCKDCKHKGTKNCVANAWAIIFGVIVKDDFYCGLAERRTDESD